MVNEPSVFESLRFYCIKNLSGCPKRTEYLLVRHKVIRMKTADVSCILGQTIVLRPIRPYQKLIPAYSKNNNTPEMGSMFTKKHWENINYKWKGRQWSGIDTITYHFPSKTPKGKKEHLKQCTIKTLQAEGQFFPQRLVRRLSKIKCFTRVYIQTHTMREIVNHSRSTVLERSVKRLLGRRGDVLRLPHGTYTTPPSTRSSPLVNLPFVFV